LAEPEVRENLHRYADWPTFPQLYIGSELVGLSIAYHAKPKVQSEADVVLNYCGLEGVLGMLQ